MQIAGAETQVGRAALLLKKQEGYEFESRSSGSKSTVAKATLNAAEVVLRLQKEQVAASILHHLNIPTIIAYAAQAAGIIGAIKQAKEEQN